MMHNSVDKQNGAIHGWLNIPQRARIIVHSCELSSVQSRPVDFEADIEVVASFVANDKSSAVLFEDPLIVRSSASRRVII